jgi:hypothetical protein
MCIALVIYFTHNDNIKKKVIYSSQVSHKSHTFEFVTSHIYVLGEDITLNTFSCLLPSTSSSPL